MQVVNLQSQLAGLKQLQAAQGLFNGGNNSTQNPNERSSSSNYPQDVHSWLQSEYPQMVPPFNPNHINCSSESSTIYGSNNQHGYVNNHNHNSSMVLQDDQDVSLASYEASSSHHSASMASLEFENKSKWPYQETDCDLHSMAFGYPQYS